MSIKIIGTDSGVEVNTTVGKGLMVTNYNSSGTEVGTDTTPIISTEGIPIVPANGGFYSCAGRTGTAAIAATLAADTTLMAMRLIASSSRKAYVYKIRVQISIITVGTSALVPGTLGLQRFTAGNPTGGTVRVPCKIDEVGSDTSDMTQIQDLNSALTMTSVVFGTEVAMNPVPIVITGSTSSFEWIIEPSQPIVLVPGDGLCLRTRVVMPGTQTWMFTWTAYWTEK